MASISLTYAPAADLWDHQKQGILGVIEAAQGGSRRIVLTSPTGGGKCLGRGTPVLLFDGTTKAVEDVVFGDELMGPDSRPRTVLGTSFGREMLYRVKPKRSGDVYVVNESHILSLKCGAGFNKSCRSGVDGSIINISVSDYLSETNTFRVLTKGWKTGVDFPEQNVPLDPYLLGVWLGDGTSKTFEVTTADPEIVRYLTCSAKRYGVDIKSRSGNSGLASIYALNNGNRWQPNEIRDAMLSLRLLGNKHVPHIYKANTRQVRLSVLAGIIDTDGYLQRDGCYDLVFKSYTLASDVAFLARSLGFASSIRPCEKMCVNTGVRGMYWRVSVTGNVNEIPVLIERKKSGTRRQIKNHLLSSISLERIGVGDYFGFELDGDGLFLLGDFTVTHNTRMMTDLIGWAAGEAMPAALYTSRRMLFSQTGNVLSREGIDFGKRASGHETALLRDVQLCMTQSEQSAVYVRKSRKLHNAKLVLIDELHMQSGAVMQKIVDDHIAAGAIVVGFTATPLDLDGEWDELVIAGTNSELRQCGAHVPAVCYCPDAPDLKHIKKYKVGDDLTDEQNHQAIMRPGVFGRVYDNFVRLNPDCKPSILFAPDVAGSRWFAEQFHKKGLRAAHIDAKQIWLDGMELPSDDETRAEVLRQSESGEIAVLCNRFVLREGIDLPHIAHCVMACVFGSLKSYIQSGGRVIRAHHSLSEITIQDHGGNYIRHGSLNADRHWELGMTCHKVGGLRIEEMRERPETEPIICPKCGMGRLSGPTCIKCGYTYHKRSRCVVQVDGELRLAEGPSFKPHRVKMEHDTEKKWLRYFHGAQKKGRTFNQAAGYFFYCEHYFPPRNLSMMPKDPADWFERIQDVPRERLQ